MKQKKTKTKEPVVGGFLGVDETKLVEQFMTKVRELLDKTKPSEMLWSIVDKFCATKQIVVRYDTGRVTIKVEPKETQG